MRRKEGMLVKAKFARIKLKRILKLKFVCMMLVYCSKDTETLTQTQTRKSNTRSNQSPFTQIEKLSSRLTI